MPTKSTAEFISDIIIPIEQNNPDCGKLYVLVRALPDLSGTEYREEDEFDILKEWSFPTENRPGEWIEAEHIELQTLSGLIWRGGRGGRLYEAEFEGERKKIGPRDYFGRTDDYQRIEIDARKHIDECIQLGVEAKRVRLTGRIKNWRPYLLWNFALDCVERAYGFTMKSVSNIYREAIKFARACSKYECGIERIELEEWLRASSANKDFSLLCWNKKNEFINLISEQSELGSTLYLQKALLQAFDAFNPFQVTNHIQTAMTYFYMGEFRKEYEYPGISTEPKEHEISSRIWYALQKKELDWQVIHMNTLLED